MTRRRFLRFLLIGTAVVLFTGYFAFQTFFFNPLEGRYGAGLPTLLPRNVDFFLAKVDLQSEFQEFPRLRAAAALEGHPAGRRFLESPQLRALTGPGGLEELEGRVRAELEQMPAAISPLTLFGGRGVALAGYAGASGFADARWVALGRTNWAGKLGLELVARPDWIGLSAQGFDSRRQGPLVRLAGGGLNEPLYLGRLRDVLIVANGEELALRALELAGRKGEDSFGLSGRYFDQIQSRDRGQDPFEFYIDVTKLGPALGLPMGWPDPRSFESTEVFLSRFFQMRQVRAATGTLSLGRSVELDLTAEIATELHSPFQRRLHRMRGFERGTVLSDVSRLAPADSLLFAYAQIDLAGGLREWLGAQEPALRDNLVNGIARPIWGANTLDPIVDDLDGAFRDQVALIVRPNDYPSMGPDGPPHNDREVLCWTIALWVENRERLVELRDRVIQNQGRFGIQGRTPGSSGVFTNEVQGGFQVYEFWSPVIDGTGHVASVDDGQLFLISNSYQMIGHVLSTYYQGGTRFPQLTSRGPFLALVPTGLVSSTAFVWIQPAGGLDALRRLWSQAARDDVLRDVDWVAERQRTAVRIAQERFPGTSYDALPDGQRLQVDALVDESMAGARDRLRAERLPGLLADVDRRVEWAGSIEGGMVQVQLGQRTLELAARLLFAAP